MDGTAADSAAIDETIVFLRYFKDLHDPRQPGKVCYPLDEVLLLCLLAVLAGADCFTGIALFGVKKLDLLRRFRPFKDGTPAHDHLSDILAVLDAEQFQKCFANWVAGVTGMPRGVIAIDGKCVRRSAGKKSGKHAVHMASAFAAHQRMVLGQVKVAEKPNEITTIPKILDMLAVEGGDRHDRCDGLPAGHRAENHRQEADYVLALKGNQGSLKDDVELFVAEQKARDFADTKVSRHTGVDGEHGRIDTLT